jgi:lysophospholipase L1-like esterase
MLGIIPLLPLLILDGNRVRKRIPILGDAHGEEGSEGEGDPLCISILGESTMAGVGVQENREGFAGAFARELSAALNRQIDWSLYAKSGTTARTASSFGNQLGDSDLVVVGLGGNDSFTLNSPWRWKKDIQLLISTIRKRCGTVPIVFIALPPIREFPAFTSLMQYVLGGWAALLGRVLSDVIKDEKNVFFDTRLIRLETWGKRLSPETKAEDFFCDGVHPSALTYRLWAKETILFILKEMVLYPQ